MRSSFEEVEHKLLLPPGSRFPPAVEVLFISAITVVLTLPCYWQEHIQAGDLSSHLYNAWLAGEIKRGAIVGLHLSPVWTNVLCDRVLEALLFWKGPLIAERVTTAMAVLLFFWGAFFLIHTATGKRPWAMAPILGMLAYGFALRFLNFYVSTGLCLWSLALLWKKVTWRRLIISIPLACVAATAHVLPVVWALTILIYLKLAHSLSGRSRLLLPLAFFCALGLTSVFVTFQFPHGRQSSLTIPGIASLTGVEQVWLYGPRYLIICAGVLVVWGALFLKRVDQGGLILDPVVQLWLLHVAAVVMLPSAIKVSLYHNVLSYLTQRYSLFTAIIMCAMLGCLQFGRTLMVVSVLLAIAFFAFVYSDSKEINDMEAEIAQLASTVPSGGRVVAEIRSTGVNPLAELAERPCIGHCYSYANYEAPSGAFRVRPDGPNQVVASTMDVVHEFENGQHIVTRAEAPLYNVCGSQQPGKRFSLRKLEAGERTCTVSIALSPQLW